MIGAPADADLGTADDSAVRPSESRDSRGDEGTPETRTSSETTQAEGDAEPRVEIPDSVPAPDGFPGPDEPACRQGEPCPVEVSEPCYEGRCNALGLCVVSPIPGCCVTDRISPICVS